ncbi:MAG: 30S ribosomal protein S20 [Phycisphaerales bacterium]
MPNTESAKKRVRQSQARNAVNNWRKRRIKDQTKAFLKALIAGDVNTAEAEFRKVAGLLDKIACTSTLHRNAAGRRKSRLAKRLNILKKGGTVQALPSDKPAKKAAPAAKAGASSGKSSGSSSGRKA